MLNQKLILEFSEGTAVICIPGYDKMQYSEWQGLVDPILKEARLELSTGFSWKYLFIQKGSLSLQYCDRKSEVPKIKHRSFYNIEDFYNLEDADSPDITHDYLIY